MGALDREPARVASDPARWHIPLAEEGLALGEAVAGLHRCGDAQEVIPLLVQLVENPRFQKPGFQLFHGAVDLATHDCIHVLLGRGMLPKDEAFVIGFTMGSTHRVTTPELTLYTFLASHFYPGVYRFSVEDIRVFENAVRLGLISGCRPLDEVDYRGLYDLPLGEARRALGLETDLLRAYYSVEKARYPRSPESQRLLNATPSV